MNTKIGFIGGGNMAASMIGGLVNSTSNNAVVKPDNVWLFDRNADKMEALQEQYDIHSASSAEHLAEHCQVIILAVKPNALKALMTSLAPVINAKQPLLISVAAGIQSSTIERWLTSQDNVPVSLIRVMPNTPSLIGLGASGVYANQHVNQGQKQLTTQILSTIGISHWVKAESDIDLVTALSGSGPAYFMLFIKNLIDTAEKAGLKSADAQALALQTAIGAAQMIKHSNLPIEQLISNISSPNGTTERAVKSLREANLSGIVSDAFHAAKTRSQEMASEFDN